MQAPSRNVLEIGPGTGALSKYLITDKSLNYKAIEIDRESIDFLSKKYPKMEIINQDFLKMTDLGFNDKMTIIGNFPYNISSQIFFKILNHRDLVDEVVCMLQREVAKRIASPPGNKDYGILSVFLQAWYDLEYLFTVDETVFNPPPKVKSGVIRLKRNNLTDLGCSEKLFFSVVKAAFGQRRKTMRNSLRSFVFGISDIDDMLQKRPEQLSVADFVFLCKKIEEHQNNDSSGSSINS